MITPSPVDVTPPMTFYYVDEMLQEEPASPAPDPGQNVLITTARFAAKPPRPEVATINYENMPFPKQNFQDAGNSLRFINETDRLSEILSTNDQVTAVFVTGLVFAYVICLSLPVIFVTACSLYIRRIHEKKQNGELPPTRHGCYYNSPVLQTTPSRQYAAEEPPIGEVPKIVVEATDHPLASPSHAVHRHHLPPPRSSLVPTQQTHSPTPHVQQARPSSLLDDQRPAAVRILGPSIGKNIIPKKVVSISTEQTEAPPKPPLPRQYSDWPHTGRHDQAVQVPLLHEITPPPPPEQFADRNIKITESLTTEYCVIEPYMSAV